MPDFRPVLLVNGVLLATLGFAMLLPAIMDAAMGNPDWLVFAIAAMLTIFIGVALALTSRGHSANMTLRGAFVLVVVIWIVLPAFAALPLVFSDLSLSYTDAYFEAMSGLTTTGATVISGLDTAPPGILVWRSLLQWLGGLGIVVMAVALLPILKIGGMQIFKMEAFDTTEKVLPSATQLATSLTSFYAGVTALFTLFLWLAGMSAFDALNHAMTTIATGGFSTHDASVGFYDSATIDWIICIGMIAGSLPFALYLQALRGHVRPLVTDSQVHVFLATTLCLVLLYTLYQSLHTLNTGLDSQLRHAAFNVISILTGTGYTTQDYGMWGPFALTGFFIIMFIGGCAGSTSCGIKIFRFQVIAASIRVQLHKMIYPHGVFVPHYKGKPVADHVTVSVMNFIFLFILCFAVSALLLSLMGLDFVTAMSAAGSAIANVGPGLGHIVGPEGTYTSLPVLAKWILCITMLVGRLEVFTVLVLLAPGFWRS